MRALIRTVLILIVVAGMAAGLAAYSIAGRGLSTRVEPSGLETRIAGAMRYLATPSAVRSRANPVQATEEVFAEGLEHFADHCAVCHGNDGRGDTPIGRALYPRAPDMRAQATQNLSDGEMFSIIENGIRLTGMPAWGTGTPEGERSSWELVHFIRRLPRLTPDDIAKMESLNPRSPAEFREEEETRRFLAGEEEKPAPKPSTHDHRQ
jgi:mono/diheme cytochrome c family protein